MTEYAGALMNNAMHLYFAGRYEQGLSSAQKSLFFYKQLYCKDKKNYASNYARSLSNAASYLSNADQYDKALWYAKQNLEIHQQLAEKSPDLYEVDLAISLSNTSNYLSKLEKPEEAFSYAKQSLEICRGLAQKNPDRYKQHYAMSLNNISNRLSEIGLYRDALSYSKQALDIYKTLVDNKPDRYEPDYATVLSSKSIRLSEIGEYNNALRLTEQKLKIFARLAAKCPERFAENKFATTCEVLYCKWLINSGNIENFLELPNIPTKKSYRHQELQFYKNFLLACCTDEQSTRSEQFPQAIVCWNQLSSANKIKNQACWLCTAAWCATFAPETIADTDWLASWKQFKEQRQGRIPAWMERTAENLSFQWPE